MAHENEIALLATLQEEAVKEAAKKHKKTHRGQRKKRKGKRESTAAESGDGVAQADEILREDWETSGNGLHAPERAGADHCSTSALDLSEDMKREFAAVLDKSEGAGVPNGKAPVALIHADSTDRVFQDSARSGNLAVELTAWKDTPNGTHPSFFLSVHQVWLLLYCKLLRGIGRAFTLPHQVDPF